MKDADDSFITAYVKWIRDNTKAEMKKTELGTFTQITTPFLDRHNDHLQIYVKTDDDGTLTLTDGGYIINDLELCGVDVGSSPKRKEILKSVINGAGIQFDSEQLFVKTDMTNFAPKKHSLLQAMLTINDMFMLSKSQINNIFLEDVQVFFDSYDIRYIQSVPFFGTSGLPHTFEFAIPASRKRPERLIRTINDVTREKIDSILFSWDDIKEKRKIGSKLYVFLNDADKTIKHDYISALNKYGADAVIWSQRSNYIDALAS